MPLPPALAARLAKRGLIEPSKSRPKPNRIIPNVPGSASAPVYVEEIIAESYDDPNTENIPLPPPIVSTNSNPVSLTIRFKKYGHFGCPNRYNVYHSCSQFCVTRWGRGRLTADYSYNMKRLKMLKKYPLPAKWAEIYDPGCARYYYWNLENGEVGWRSPGHPKAVFARPASEFRSQLLEKGKEPPPSVVSQPPSQKSSGLPRRERDRNDHDRDRIRSGRDRDRYRDRDSRYGKEKDKRRRDKPDDLDPMDPAAYSDIPRGGWSTGMETSVEGKTGVDSTATGPLFQQRPYPSPGDVLRANASNKAKKLKKK